MAGKSGKEGAGVAKKGNQGRIKQLSAQCLNFSPGKETVSKSGCACSDLLVSSSKNIHCRGRERSLMWWVDLPRSQIEAMLSIQGRGKPRISSAERLNLCGAPFSRVAGNQSHNLLAGGQPVHRCVAPSI